MNLLSQGEMRREQYKRDFLFPVRVSPDPRGGATPLWVPPPPVFVALIRFTPTQTGGGRNVPARARHDVVVVAVAFPT